MKPDDIPQGILDQVRGFMSKHDVYIGIDAEHDMAMMLFQARSQAYAELPDAIDLYRFLKNNRLRKRSDIAKAIAQAIHQHSQKGEDK
jgi:hypothetical protein